MVCEQRVHSDGDRLFLIQSCVLSVCRTDNFWNAVIGLTSTDWLLGSRKAEIPSAGREPQMLCISLSPFLVMQFP